MNRTIRRIALLLAAALVLGACQLDKPQDYTFCYSLYYKVADEEAQTAVKEYFKSKIDFEKTFTIYAEQFDAIQQANQQFLKDVEPIKNEEVLALIDKDDIVQMTLDIYTAKGKMGVAGAIYWFHDPDSEDGEAKE